jgi:hypothetical protein
MIKNLKYLPLTLIVAFAMIQLIGYLTGANLIIPTIILGILIALTFLFFCASACGIALGFIAIAIYHIFKSFSIAK